MLAAITNFSITNFFRSVVATVVSPVVKLNNALRSLFLTDRNVIISLRDANPASPSDIRMQMSEGATVTINAEDLLAALRLADVAGAYDGYSVVAITPKEDVAGLLADEAPGTWAFTAAPREHLDVYLLEDHNLIISPNDIFEDIRTFLGEDITSESLVRLLNLRFELSVPPEQGKIEQLSDGSFKFIPKPRAVYDEGERKFQLQLRALQPETTEADAEKEPQEASIEEPSIEEPSIEEPSIEEPSIEEPSIEEPALERTITVTEMPDDYKYEAIKSALPKGKYWVLPAEGEKGTIVEVDEANPAAAQKRVDEYNDKYPDKRATSHTKIAREHHPLVRVFKDNLAFPKDLKDYPGWRRAHSFTVTLRKEDGTELNKTLCISSAPSAVVADTVEVGGEPGVPLIIQTDNLSLGLPPEAEAEFRQVNANISFASENPKLESNHQRIIVVPKATTTGELSLDCTVRDDVGVLSKLYSGIKRVASATKNSIIYTVSNVVSKAGSFLWSATKLTASTAALAIGLFFLGGGLLTPFYYSSVYQLVLVPFYLRFAASALLYAGPAASLLTDVTIGTVKTVFAFAKRIVAAFTLPVIDAYLLRSGFAEEAAKRPIGQYYAKGVIPWNAQLERGDYPNPNISVGGNFDMVFDFWAARLVAPIFGFRWEYPDRLDRFKGYMLRNANLFYSITGLHKYARDLYKRHNPSVSQSAVEAMDPNNAPDLDELLAYQAQDLKAKQFKKRFKIIEKDYLDGNTAKREEIAAMLQREYPASEYPGKAEEMLDFLRKKARRKDRDAEPAKPWCTDKEEVDAAFIRQKDEEARELIWLQKARRAEYIDRRNAPFVRPTFPQPEEGSAEEAQAMQQVQISAGGGGGDGPAEPATTTTIMRDARGNRGRGQLTYPVQPRAGRGVPPVS